VLIKWKIEIIVETLQKKIEKKSFRETLNFINNNNYSGWEEKKFE